MFFTLNLSLIFRFSDFQKKGHGTMLLLKYTTGLTYCFLPRENPATKKLSSKLNTILCEVVKIVSHIKGSSLNLKLFTLFCEEMPADHNHIYLMAACAGCQWEKSCRKYINSKTSWHCFCIVKSQNGHIYFEMNIGLPCSFT